MLDRLCGFDLVRTACTPEFVRWKRASRRKRQNKKWRKRYGAVTRCFGKSAYQMGRRLYACACVFSQIEREAKG